MSIESHQRLPMAFCLKVCKHLTVIPNTLSTERLYINDFHRSNSMAAQREQKLHQIARIRQHSTTTKESANAERSRKL